MLPGLLKRSLLGETRFFQEPRLLVCQPLGDLIHSRSDPIAPKHCNIGTSSDPFSLRVMAPSPGDAERAALEQNHAKTDAKAWEVNFLFVFFWSRLFFDVVDQQMAIG